MPGFVDRLLAYASAVGREDVVAETRTLPVSEGFRKGAADDPVTDGQVIGIGGLSVADVAAVPRANASIPTIMVAERLAATIRRA